MKSTKAVLIGCSISLLIMGCSHKQVQTRTMHDSKMSCTEIAMETAKVEMVLEDIDSKTGFSGRNVGMGILFWPGIIVNQMNAGDAREAANERLEVLAELGNKKECNVDKADLQKHKEKLKKEVEAKAKSTEEKSE